MGERKHEMIVYKYSAQYNCCETSDCKPVIDVEMNAEMSPEEFNKYFNNSESCIGGECALVRKERASINFNLNDSKKAKKVGRFGGYITLLDGKDVYITKVIYNKPVVIVFWSDGVKTRSTCDDRDTWNPEFGLSLCVMKRYMTNEQLNSMYRDWYSEEIKDTYFSTDLKEVRKKQKEMEKKQ